jgi:hypothetical protein
VLQVGIPKPVRKTVNKLAECGLLFSKVRKFADVHSVDRAFGLVGQVLQLTQLVEFAIYSLYGIFTLSLC